MSLTDISPKKQQEYQASPVGVLSTKCWYCGTPYVLKLERASARYREAADLVYNSHPVKVLSDERLHAASLYLPLSRSQRKRYEAEKIIRLRPKSGRSPAQQAYQPSARLDAKERKAKQERDNLLARARAFVAKKQGEFKRRAGRGDEPFPIDEKLKALEGTRCHYFDQAIKAQAKTIRLEDSGHAFYEYTQGIVNIRNCIIDLRKREACELVVWGNVSPETLSEIAFFEAQESVLAAESLEQQREAKEKYASEAEERRLADVAWREKQAQRYNPQPAPQTVPASVAIPNIQSSSFWNDVGSDLIDPSDILAAANNERPEQKLPEDPRDLLREYMGNSKGREPVRVPYIPPEDTKPTLPPDDGRGPYYIRRLQYYRDCGVWPDDRMLGLLGLGQ